jgi:hypothetical protein
MRLAIDRCGWLPASASLLIDRDLDAGTYVQSWDTSRLAHGVYLLRLSAPLGHVTWRAVLR